MAVPWNKTEIKVVNNKVNVSFFSLFRLSEDVFGCIKFFEIFIYCCLFKKHFGKF